MSETVGPVVALEEDGDEGLHSDPGDSLQRRYTTEQAARFFPSDKPGKLHMSTPWMYWAMSSGVFTCPEGTRIVRGDRVIRRGEGRRQGTVTSIDGSDRVTVRWSVGVGAKKGTMWGRVGREELLKLIEPEHIGSGKHRRFTLAVIRDMAMACLRRGNYTPDQVREVLRRIEVASRDGDILADAPVPQG